MWNNFEGLARTREQTLARINALQWTNWRPQGITLHNTAAPTLEQWAETGPRHDARIRNLQSFYENKKAGTPVRTGLSRATGSTGSPIRCGRGSTRAASTPPASASRW